MSADKKRLWSEAKDFFDVDGFVFNYDSCWVAELTTFMMHENMRQMVENGAVSIIVIDDLDPL